MHRLTIFCIVSTWLYREKDWLKCWTADKQGYLLSCTTRSSVTDPDYRLIHFMPPVSFHIPWKHQRMRGCVTSTGGIERGQWHEMGLKIDSWIVLFSPFKHFVDTLYQYPQLNNFGRLCLIDKVLQKYNMYCWIFSEPQ